MYNKIKKSFRIDDENYLKIKSFLDKNNITFSALVNSAIFNFFQTKKNENLKLPLTTKGNNKSKSIRVDISENEFVFLSNLAKFNGFNSVKQEIKFLLLNSIADKDEKLFNNLEMKELTNAINDLNKLGRNINEIVKLLRDKKPYEFSLNFDNFSKILTDINIKIDNINKIIITYRQKLNLKVF